MTITTPPNSAAVRSKRNTNWARVAIVALVAVTGSLLAAAGPAAADQHDDDPMPELTTSLSACVGDATEEHGFVDLSGQDAERQDAINCLAYYGITVGKTVSPPTYDPAGNVTRGQMALFLYRAADVAGVDFTPAADDPAAMFSDIGALGDAWQTAIKALYAKGIMTGRMDGLPGTPSNDTFVPHEPINRAEMGVYLRNLVRAASPDLFDSRGQLKGVTTLDRFSDAYNGTPGPVSEAISQAYELGITAGKTTNPLAFDPAGLVTRSQMSLFITRTLAHTTARPAGLTAQTVEGEWTVAVSVRDADLDPVLGARVDIFVATPADLVDNDGEDVSIFGRSGSCSPMIVRVPDRDEFMFGYGYDLCEIDDGDEKTDENGDVTFDLSHESGTEGLVVWVWTGGRYDEYDADSRGAVMVEFPKGEQPPPQAEVLTATIVGYDDMANPIIHADEASSVKVEVQLQGRYSPEDEWVDVPAPAGTEYTVNRDLLVTNADTTTTTVQSPTETITLSEDGSATFRLVAPRNIVQTGVLTITVSPADDESDPPKRTFAATISNDDPAVTTVKAVAVRGAWHPIEDAATPADAQTQIRVTVTDQYGDVMTGADATVRLAGASVDLADSIPDPDDRAPDVKRQQDGVPPTGGYAQFMLVRKEATGFPTSTERANGFVETVTAWVDIPPAEPADSYVPMYDPAADPQPDEPGNVTVYWAASKDADGYEGMNEGMDFMVVHVDPRNQQVIVHKEATDDEVYVVSYDGHSGRDRFYVDPDDSRDTESDFAAFQAALRRVLAGTAKYTLSWDKTNSRSWEFILEPVDMMG